MCMYNVVDDNNGGISKITKYHFFTCYSGSQSHFILAKNIFTSYRHITTSKGISKLVMYHQIYYATFKKFGYIMVDTGNTFEFSTKWNRQLM